MLKPALCCAAVFIVLGLGISAYTHHKKGQEAPHVAEADQDGKRATAAATKAAVLDAQAQDDGEGVALDGKTVAQLRAELARLRKATVPQAPAKDARSGPPSPITAAPVDLAPVVAKQGELIDAQDKQIQDQSKQISTLTLARDSWKLSAQNSQAQAVQEHAARVAAEGLAEGNLWKGRMQGFAVGFGAGYLAGRRP